MQKQKLSTPVTGYKLLVKQSTWKKKLGDVWGELVGEGTNVRMLVVDFKIFKPKMNLWIILKEKNGEICSATAQLY